MQMFPPTSNDAMNTPWCKRASLREHCQAHGRLHLQALRRGAAVHPIQTGNSGRISSRASAGAGLLAARGERRRWQPAVRGLRRWRGAAGGTDGGSGVAGMLVRARRLVRTGQGGRQEGAQCTICKSGFFVECLRFDTQQRLYIFNLFLC
jgi:hypothetical protein